MNFAVGDRVIFARNPCKYRVGDSNPLKGTRFFCEGIVEKVDGYVWVKWDNGCKNDYSVESLDKARPVFKKHPLTKIFV